MKRKDLDNLKSKTVSELDTLAADLRKQILKAKMDLSLRKTKNTNMAKLLKKDLARVLTFKNEKELNS